MEHHSHQRWEFLVQNKRNNFSISGILNFMFSLSLSVSPYFDVSVSLVLFQSFGSQSVVMTVSGFSIGNGCQSNTVRCGLFCSDSKLSRLTIVRLTIQYGVTITAFEIVCYCYASVQQINIISMRLKVDHCFMAAATTTTTNRGKMEQKKK